MNTEHVKIRTATMHLREPGVAYTLCGQWSEGLPAVRPVRASVDPLCKSCERVRTLAEQRETKQASDLSE